MVRANSGYCAKPAAGDGALAPLYYPPPPLLKKPALRLCPLVEEKEEKEEKEKKKSSIWRLIAMLVDIGLAVVLQLLQL